MLKLFFVDHLTMEAKTNVFLNIKIIFLYGEIILVDVKEISTFPAYEKNFSNSAFLFSRTFIFIVASNVCYRIMCYFPLIM